MSWRKGLGMLWFLGGEERRGEEEILPLSGHDIVEAGQAQDIFLPEVEWQTALL